MHPCARKPPAAEEGMHDRWGWPTLAVETPRGSPWSTPRVDPVDELLTRLFWALVAAFVIAAFAMEPGIYRWIPAGGMLIVGLLVGLCNWSILITNMGKRTPISLVPVVGAPLIFVGMLRAPNADVQSVAPIAFILDPYYLRMAYGVVRMLLAGNRGRQA